MQGINRYMGLRRV